MYNPNPGTPEEQDEKELLEAAVYTKHVPKQEKIVRFQETVLLATMLDSNPEPKSYHKRKNSGFRKLLGIYDNRLPNTWNKKIAWDVLPKTSIPAYLKVIGAQRVYPKKSDGQFRARCVAKGLSQIPGKDFQDNHAPPVSDTILHLLLTSKTAFKSSSGQFNIETAYLYGELEEELWTAIPD
jgi:Reverse transcriptase (RNA-dependent DNA polymerase)